MNSAAMMQLAPLVLLIFIMYFLLIRPQKKRDKTVNEMRSNLKIGDEIITIGGIYGKVVKLKDESLVIEVGSDKTRFEVARWAISRVQGMDPGAAQKKSAGKQEQKEEEKKPAKRARLIKSEEPSAVAETETPVASEPETKDPETETYSDDK